MFSGQLRVEVLCYDKSAVDFCRLDGADVNA